jgi:hypothetical protein
VPLNVDRAKRLYALCNSLQGVQKPSTFNLNDEVLLQVIPVALSFCSIF